MIHLGNELDLRPIVLGVAFLSITLPVFLGVSPFRYILIALCLLEILLLCFQKKEVLLDTGLFKATVCPWLPWVCFSLILAWVHQSSDFITPLKHLLVFILLYIAFVNSKYTRKTYILCLSLCLLGLSGVCMGEILSHGLGSFIFNANKNPVLGVITLMNVCCLSYLLTSEENLNRTEILLVIAAITCALATTILAEVRSSLLAYAASGVVFLLSGNNNRKALWLIILVFLILIFLSLLTGRLQQGFNDLEKYRAGQSFTSWGLRIEMWKMALKSFPEAPIFGWGFEPVKSMVEAGFTFPLKSWKFTRFHSDFFQILSCGGLVLISAWLATIIWLAKQAIKDSARLCLLFSILAMGLVDNFWYSKSVSFAFVILWCILSLTSAKSMFKQSTGYA